MSGGAMTEAQARSMLAKALAHYEANPGGLVLRSVARSLYKPDKRLKQLLKAFGKYAARIQAKETATEQERAAAGQLLEQIAFVAFDSIMGREKIKSFPSALAQFDLYVSGRDQLWTTFARRIGVNPDAPGIVVECKAREDRVSDQGFGRLCLILAQDLYGVASLGVFFTILGATGFPKQGEPAQQKIGDARLRQVVFHARTTRPIVVFDAADILGLGEPGSLLLALERKVEDIQTLSGLPTTPVTVELEVQLPVHLAKLIKK